MIKSAGRHLIIDAVLGVDSREIVSSTELMSTYLEKVTDITGMTLVIPPIAMKFPYSGETRKLMDRLIEEGTTSPAIREFINHINDRDNNKGGVSAITVWLESHASLHSWPLDNYISIDLYSCKNFDYEPVLKFTKDYMKLEKMFCLVVDRKMNSLAEFNQFIY